MNRPTTLSALLLGGILLASGVLLAAPVQAEVEGSGGVAADPVVAAQTVAAVAPARLTAIPGRVDHVAAGTGLRNFNSGTIRLRGIPAGSTTVLALLYWAMICAADPCPSFVDIEFEGRTIRTTRFCSGPQPCWVTGKPFGVYRATVTSFMPRTTAANGDYQIGGFPSHPAERDGRDPWVPVTASVPKVDGATLVVVYSNPSLAMGTVHIHNGCDFFVGILDASLALVPAAPAPPTFARFTRFGADGQVGSSTDASPAISDEKTFIGGPGACPVGLSQIAGDGSLEDHDSDWNGHDGGPLNQLWDTRTSTVTGRLGGGGNYCVHYVSSGDCMNAIGYVLTVK